MAATWNNATWNHFVWNQTGSGGSPTGGGQKPKPTHMRDLTIYLENPFDDPHFGMDKLVSFSIDHQAKLIANNPGGVFAARITALAGALSGVENNYTDDKTKLALRKSKKQAKDNFRTTLPAAIAKIYGVVLGKFGDDSPVMTEIFPQGRTVFTACKDGDVAEELQTLVNGLTAHQAELGAQVVTDATALKSGWDAVYGTAETSTGNKTSTMEAKNAARAALQLVLFENLLAIAQQFPRQPEKLALYMDQNLLKNHPAAPATPTPTPTPTPPGP